MARWLAPLVVVLVALGLRVWHVAPYTVGADARDPDGYVWYARQLADGTQAWQWTPDAVRYGDFYKAPLYQVALSILTGQPDWFPMPAAGMLAHCVLGALTVLGIFLAGRELHSARAGLLAAGVWAVWIPDIQRSSMFWQEHLYLVLLAGALALAGRAFHTGRVIDWCAAGAVFGLAALTRSAVLYALVPTALVALALSLNRRTAYSVAALLGAFALVVAPYVWTISRTAGQFVLVENIGFYTMAGLAGDQTHAPTSGQALRGLTASAVEQPWQFAGTRAAVMLSLVKPQGAALLPSVTTRSRSGARWAKAGVHAAVDLPFMVALVLAPLGAALCRRPALGGALLLGVVLYVTTLAVPGWAGFRFRAPIEPVVFLLAAVALAGGRKRPGRPVRIGSTVLAAAAVLVVAINVPSLTRARANYGVSRWHPGATEGQFTGSAGFHAAAAGSPPRVALEVAGASDADGGELRARVGAEQWRPVPLSAGTRTVLEVPVPAPGVYYLECDARQADGTPATVTFSLR
jgi:hypothetical protein